MTIKNYMLDKEHVGQKIYEIEEERIIVIKTHVIAKDEDEAFNKYLECDDTSICENHEVKDNGSDVVNSYAKDYGEGYKGTKLVGKVIEEKAFPNDEEDDSMDIKVEYGTVF